MTSPTPEEQRLVDLEATVATLLATVGRLIPRDNAHERRILDLEGRANSLEQRANIAERRLGAPAVASDEELAAAQAIATAADLDAQQLADAEARAVAEWARDEPT